MASKYVAAKDFGTFKQGDDVTVAQAGDDTEAWLADGSIVLREAADDSSPAPSGLLPTPAAQIAPAKPASYVTLGSSPDGMPRFTAVDSTPE